MNRKIIDILTILIIKRTLPVMKKKRSQKKIARWAVYALLTILLLIGIGLNILVLNTTIEEPYNAVFPPTKETLPTPTFVTFENEFVITVSEKLVTQYDNNLEIGGGSVEIRDYVDGEGRKQSGLTMFLYIGKAEAILAYVGLKTIYQSYRIRILDIDEKGFSILAISQTA